MSGPSIGYGSVLSMFVDKLAYLHLILFHYSAVFAHL